MAPDLGVPIGDAVLDCEKKGKELSTFGSSFLAKRSKESLGLSLSFEKNGNPPFEVLSSFLKGSSFGSEAGDGVLLEESGVLLLAGAGNIDAFSAGFEIERLYAPEKTSSFFVSKRSTEFLPNPDPNVDVDGCDGLGGLGSTVDNAEVVGFA